MASISMTNETEYKSQSRWAIVFRQLRKNKGAVTGLAIIVILIVVALSAPIISPYDPIVQSRDTLEPPSSKHLMGTDIFGRDLLSRVIFGSRISLRIGVMAVALGASVGLVIGLIGGYYGGQIDTLLGIYIDTMLAFPGILLALAIVSVLQPRLTNVMVAVGLASVPRYARLVRGSVLSEKEQDYVEGARVVGCRDHRIIFRHILPNVIAPVIVYSTLSLGTATLTAAGLGFLGLGAQPPTPEWGLMVSGGREYLRSAWWMATFPGLAIMVTVVSTNLLGDGFRDALDPRLRI